MCKVIISYDCEGVWGMLDKIDTLNRHIFNHKNLITTYEQLVSLHEEFDLKATFAFVGALISTKEEFHNALKKYPNAIRVNKWCKPILTDKCNFSEKDIYLPELLELIQNTNINHEISSHGFSHLIMDKELDNDSLEFEISGIKDLAHKRNIEITSVIFPRNVINYEFINRTEFIFGYRAAPKLLTRFELLNRVYSLIKEFIPVCSSEQSDRYNGKVIIPGGFFVNWRSGARRLVPIWLTVLRFRIALKHAKRKNGLVHIWLHPHNLATGKNQMLLLRKLFYEINDFKKKHGLTVLTQADFINTESIEDNPKIIQ